MKLSNKTYDICKWVLMTVVPALIVLISALGKIYNFEEVANTINLTIGAFAIFFRSILGISTKNYNSKQAKKGKK